MSIIDEILGAIDNAFALLGILDVISICGILIAYWAGILSGNATILAGVILGFANIIVGAVISDVIQELIKGIVTAIGTVIEGIANAIGAIFSLFK